MCVHAYTLGRACMFDYVMQRGTIEHYVILVEYIDRVIYSVCYNKYIIIKIYLSTILLWVFFYKAAKMQS